MDETGKHAAAAGGDAAVAADVTAAQADQRAGYVLVIGREMCALVGADAAGWAVSGLETTCVQTGVDALRELLNYDFAAVLVSSTLPDISPPVLLEQVTELAPGAALVTAAPPPATGACARAAGRMHVLAPPVDAAWLLTVVTQAFARGVPARGPHRFDLLHGVLRIDGAVMETVRTQEALSRVCDELAELTGALAVAMYLQRAPEPSFVAASRQPMDAAQVRRLTVEVEQAFLRLTGSPPVPAALQAFVRDETAPTPAPLGEIVHIPLLADHQIRGILCAAFDSASPPSADIPPLLFYLANHATLVHQEVWRARNMATRDPLTGLYNKGMFTETLKQSFSLAQRKHASIGLLLFDFDNLKGVNDQHGHLVGDKVLAEAAGLTLATVRTSDIVARFGGDEFAVILPDTNAPAARLVAERLVGAFRDRQFVASGAHLGVTVSVGVAAICPTTDVSSQALLAQADEALLAAKRGGRDRVCGVAEAAGPDASGAPLPAAAGDVRVATDVRGRVLILDDEHAVRDILGKMLRMFKFETVSCATLEEAMLAIETDSRDFDVVLTDLRLGNGTGIDLLQALKDKAPWTVKMVVSGYASKETAIECLRHGAFDFIEKPFAMTQLSAAMDRAMEHRRLLLANHRYQVQLEDLVRARSESLSRALDSLRRSYSQTIQTLALMIDAREANTGLHCRAAREAVRLLALRMNISHHDLEILEMGAVLHDLGKIGIPDAILQKPGPLTPEERIAMQKHPCIGHEVLAGVPFLNEAAEIVLHHHEAFDGSGYPSGLKGEEICVGARIFAVIDAYHAMRFERCYRPVLSPEAARDEIVRCSGRQFDPKVVTAFVACQPEIEAAFLTVGDRAAKPAPDPVVAAPEKA